MNKSFILILLKQFNKLLKEKDIQLKLYVVGGASLLLNGYSRPTVDIDTINEELDLEEIRSIIKEMSVDYELPVDWLNNEAGGLAPDTDKFIYSEKLEYSSLTVYVANDRYILASKLYSGRDKDLSDSIHLCKNLNIQHDYQLRDLYLEFYKVNHKWDKVQLFINKVIETLNKT
jgi:hypothetical protein